MKYQGAFKVLVACACSVVSLSGCTSKTSKDQPLASALSSSHIPKATIDCIQRMRMDESFSNKGGAGVVDTNAWVDLYSQTNHLLFLSSQWAGRSWTNEEVVALYEDQSGVIASPDWLDVTNRGDLVAFTPDRIYIVDFKNRQIWFYPRQVNESRKVGERKD